MPTVVRCPLTRRSCALVTLTLVASLPLIAAVAVRLAGASDGAEVSPLVALSTGLAAAVAAGTLAHSGRHFTGVMRQVHMRMALGCAVWAAGVLPYIGFVLTGGSVESPAVWTQIGFLGAYVPWAAALWKLRQPLITENRGHLREIFGVELAAFVLVAAAILGALWHPSLGTAENVALLVPVVLDLLMLAAAYNTVRRASLGVDALYGWLVAAFTLLALCDATVTYGVASGPNEVVVAAGNVGYLAVFLTMAMAAGRSLHLRESPLAGERLTVAVASIGLALLGPAATLAPPLASRLLWLVGAFLAWRMFALVRVQHAVDEDRLTGMFDARAIGRHANNMVMTATPADPVGVVTVDLTGFGRWNAENGFLEGDALLTRVSDGLLSYDAHPGAWGRVGPDRFCWVGRVRDGDDVRAAARRFVDVASCHSMGLPVRAGAVFCPVDAQTGENALAAAEEAVVAAKSSAGGVVSFDQGLLEGADPDDVAAASLRARRGRVQAMIDDLYVIRPVFQPIVRLDGLDIVGYEALSRMHIDPRMGPDRWIAEANTVGLGVDLEAECIRRALTVGVMLDRDRYLSVNASPRLIASGMLDDLMPDGPLHWLMLEITEHDQVSDYAHLTVCLAGLRARGVRVAIDDLGAGHSSLRHITGLSPDFAKLDREFVVDVDRDHVKQALLRSMVAFTRETSCALIAEGIETHAQWVTLRDLGVTLGQGYAFQRPSPALLRRLSTPPEPDTAPIGSRHPVAVTFGASAHGAAVAAPPVPRPRTPLDPVEATRQAVSRLVRPAD